MNAIVLSAYGPDAPSYKQYAYIDSYSLAGKEVSVTSPKGNRYVGDFILKTGVNIATELQILENLIKTEIQSVEYVLNETDNYLLNASFVKDMEAGSVMTTCRYWRLRNCCRPIRSTFPMPAGLPA